MHLKLWTAVLLPFALLVHSRTFDERGLQARHDHDADLYARDIDDDLYARDMEDDLYARDMEDDLYTRDMDDDLYTRDMDDDLYARDLDAELLFERELLSDNRFLYGRDLEHIEEARDLDAQIHERDPSPIRQYSSGTIEQSPCGDKRCKGTVKGNVERNLVASCNTCKKKHHWVESHGVWVLNPV
ncbi:hypothetical protein MMC32_005837 [Xylographa parallela]|nr:hypothetical protein [Xylographa parallela]